MKATAKSSITLPPAEVELVERLKKKTAAKSNVEVIRRGLRLLESSLDREALRAQFVMASKKVSQVSRDEMSELDSLAAENLADEN